MSASLASIMDTVNTRLENREELGNATVQGDGLAMRFHLPDHYIDDDGSLKTYKVINGVSTELAEHTGWDCDYLTSWVSYLFDTPLTAAESLNFTYRFRHWPLSLVRHTVNAGIAFLYPEFYRIEELTITLGTATDYPLLATDPVAGVTEVDLVVGDQTTRLQAFNDYRVMRGALETAALRIFNAGSSGSLVVRVAVHPHSFPSDDHTLALIGLPDRMENSLIYYACWQLLNQKIAPRVRTDTVTPMQQEGLATFRDQVQASQYYKMMLDMEVARTKMRRWSIRGL